MESRRPSEERKRRPFIKEELKAPYVKKKTMIPVKSALDIQIKKFE